MSLESMIKDTITVFKQDGTKIENIKASVQSNKIITFRGDILIEPSDVIQRKMSNGGEETFKVIDPNFYESHGGIKAHYQMDVQKLGLPEAKKAIQNITYNINGANARVNQNSVDNSTNIIVVNNKVKNLFKALRSEIKCLELGEKEKQSALDIVDAMEQNLIKDKPSKVVLSALSKGLPLVANIGSITSAILALMK